MTPARQERLALCDLFDEVGPDAPTLCEGWQTRHLAAHLLLRERRPDVGLGIVVPAFAGHADKVTDAVAQKDFAKNVATVRNGPPLLSPTRLAAVDRLANTAEFFVHHEDVLRAQPGWTPRDLEAALVRDLRTPFGRVGLLTRGFGRPLEFRATDVDETVTAVASDSAEPVVVSGPIGELILFAYGRQASAKVEITGPADGVAAAQAGSFGI